MNDDERESWADLAAWSRTPDLETDAFATVDASVIRAVDDELTRMRAEVTKLNRSLAAVTAALDGTGKALADALAERDALVECGLTHHDNGRWVASIGGNYALGTFRTRDEAIAAILNVANADATEPEANDA